MYEGASNSDEINDTVIHFAKRCDVLSIKKHITLIPKRSELKLYFLGTDAKIGPARAGFVPFFQDHCPEVQRVLLIRVWNLQ